LGVGFFTYSSFCRSSPKPVRQTPFAVNADDSDNRGRNDFGLPKDQFLFGFAFDGLSSFYRKAPDLAIRAFQIAFEPDDRSVGLVIKKDRASEDPAWNKLINLCKDDQRTRFLTQSLTRGILLDLWRSTDCFVSLHRSEGFGRNIAEMMLLKRPVIATAHSCNMDYTNYDTVALVRCDLVPVQEGEYPSARGSFGQNRTSLPQQR
jgi:glycosyltransferase involved in cell wall biosynthesis